MPNPTRYQAGWPTAVIASAHQTGVLGMRNLARRHVPVCCIDCDATLPGFRNIYGSAHRCPNPDEDGEGWLRFMIALAAKLPSKPALIPASDQFVSAIATHAAQLKKLYRIGDAPELQERLGVKATLYDLAREHGMPIPRTADIHSSDDLFHFAKAARFPCLIKPMSARAWECFPPGHPLHLQKVAVAEDPAALMSCYKLVQGASPTVVAQEIISGPDTAKYVYFSCYNRRGVRVAHAMFRELRCSPNGFGCATVCEARFDAEIDWLCDNFLRKCGCRGICEIELKRDSRTGAILLIEANPRLSGSGDAATYVGVDICWTHYLDLVGIDLAPAIPSGKMIRHIVLRRDALALREQVAKGRFSWSELFRSYRPPVAFYDLDLRDFCGVVDTLSHVARVVLSPLIPRFKSR